MKPLPNSSQAEETVIASILLDGIETMQIALDKKVCEDSFFDERNKLLWKTFLWAFKRGTPLEHDAIVAALTEKGKLAQVGGIEHLLNVTQKVPTTSGTRHAIDKLQELLMLREIIKRSHSFIEAARDYTGDMAQLTTSIEECLKIRDGLEKTLTLADSCDDIESRLKRVLSGEIREGDNGMPWPWKEANRWLGPIQNGELVIIAARPSQGKSSVARQLAWHWSKIYGEVMLFSREMPVSELPPLFAQSLCGHSWREARNGRLHKKDVGELIESLKEVKANTSLKVFDRDRTLTQIVARVKAQCLKKKPVAIFIDYLQIYDPEQQKGETRDVALGRFCRTLKDLANDVCPVIALAQLSRLTEKENRAPMLSDLRESGSIECEASRVVAINWKSEHDGIKQTFGDQSQETIFTQLIQLKGRAEGMAICDGVPFHRPTATFKA